MKTKRAGVVRGAALAITVVATLVACRAVLGIEEFHTGGGSIEAGGAAVSDSAVQGDAAPDQYNALDDRSKWTTFDVGSIDSKARGFFGGVFDGRFLYLIPFRTNGSFHGTVARYDTQALFENPQSWKTFDIARINPAAKGFLGGAFDGRFVYFVPFRDDGGTFHGIVTRYDTMKEFVDDSAWETHTLTSSNNSYLGALFDGRHIYLVPHFSNVPNSIAVRFDSQRDFADSNSWETFDLASLSVSAKGFSGGAVDDRFVYFAPCCNLQPGATLMRYDTQASSFTEPSAWLAFDVSTVNLGAKAFGGAVFDGDHLYLAPSFNGNIDGLAMRYNHKQSIGDVPTAWSTFDVGTVNAGAKGFGGGVTDGRHLYLVPSNNGALNGIVARHDTTASFNASTGWKTFDLATLNAQAVDFAGAVFDGRNIYFVPHSNGTVVRFEASTILVPTPKRSFF